MIGDELDFVMTAVVSPPADVARASDATRAPDETFRLGI
jgi:hypothetical protein